jgi:hypothetical protein
MITSLENQKLALIERILSLKDVSLLSQINETVNSLINHSDKQKATLPMLTKEDIMGHIEQSLKDFQEGNYKTHEDFKKVAKNW